MRVIKTKGKRRPNVAIDMVLACIKHYKRYGRKVRAITLSDRYFHILKNGLLERDETLLIEDKVEFKDVTIFQGSTLMIKPLQEVLEPILGS
jgi:hypothetical protein